MFYAAQLHLFLFLTTIIVTRCCPAEILVSALSEFGHDKAKNSAVQHR
jgi:hypothetical protein